MTSESEGIKIITKETVESKVWIKSWFDNKTITLYKTHSPRHSC